MTTPANQVQLAFAAKDFWELGIASVALLLSLYSLRRSENAAASNIRLETRINDINSQRHWRREKIYSLADSLFDLGALYWLTDEDSTPENKMRALRIRLHLQDIEDNASAIDIDVSQEVRILSDEITGGNFEDPSRKGLSPDHKKFHKIQIEIQNIKAAINPPINAT
jgi:hypothetical protein